MNPNPFTPAHVIAKAQQGVASFEAGKPVTKARCVVKAVRTDTFRSGANAGKPYLSLTLGDRTGEIDAKSWEGAALARQLTVGTVVELERAEVDEYNGQRGLKFQPQHLRVLERGQYDPADFVRTLLPEEIEHHWGRLQERLDSIENPHLQRLREAVFAEPEVAQKYKTWPSAVARHHNYLGGNVEHVHGIMRIVDAVCAGYPDLDRDVVVFGAAVHDLGKLREYAVETTILVTDEGRLRGHLVIGAEWLAQICDRLRTSGYDFPRGLEEHLVHLILSHHKKGEWGSPKPPSTAEAMLLHLADYADSQTKGFLEFVAEHREDAEGWARRWDDGESTWVRTRRGWE